MNSMIREPDEYDAEPLLYCTLFDPPEPEQRESAETMNAGASSRGFLNTLLRALSVWTA